MQQSSTNSNTPKVIGAITISAVLLVGIYVFLTKDINNNKSSASATKTSSSSVVSNLPDTTSSTQSSASTQSSSSNSSSSNTATPSSSSSNSGYKDGSYKISVDYRVPHGSNSITVSVALKDGVVTKVSTSHDYSDRESGMYVNSFDSEISSAVNGEKVSSVSLSRVGGASLTTDAFDEAISQIASQAKA